MSAGISVVVPHGGRTRLPLLAATLAAVRRSHGDIQIVVSELGSEAVAFDAARNVGADYVFTRCEGPFVRDRVCNLGAALARQDCVAWCDGDLVFPPEFLLRARAEFMSSGCAMSIPYTRIDYLNADDTAAILAGQRDPTACMPLFNRHPRKDFSARHLFFVRRDFIERHGGMIEGFRGWGGEDCAFLHKVDLLDRRTSAAQDDLHIWHLYHPDSGSIDYQKAARANPHHRSNAALLAHIRSIDNGNTLQRLYPPPTHAPLPWPASMRIALVAAPNGGAQTARANDLAARLTAFFGVAFPVHDAMPAIADLVVGFAETAADLAALVAARGNRPAVLLPGAAQPTPLALHTCHWLLAPTVEAAAQWRACGAPVWHRIDARDGPPTALQPMSHLLGQKQHWRLRVRLARDTLDGAAFDRSPFWYVAFHDADGQEIARLDADRHELRALAAASGDTAVIERQFASARVPVRWTVQPVARNRTWLAPHSGAVDETCLV